MNRELWRENAKAMFGCDDEKVNEIEELCLDLASFNNSNPADVFQQVVSALGDSHMRILIMTDSLIKAIKE